MRWWPTRTCNPTTSREIVAIVALSYAARSRWLNANPLCTSSSKEKMMAMNKTNQDTTQPPAIKSIALFGVGPALGQAVARRYARAGYTVILVARRREPLDLLA